MKTQKASLIVCIIIAVVYMFGLWPLSFFPKNEVEWLKDQNGIRFH